MKIVFIIEKYDITVNGVEWDCTVFPVKGDKIDLFNFVYSGREDVNCPIESLEQINKDYNMGFATYIEYFAVTRFTIMDFVWRREPDGIYCEMYLADKKHKSHN